jgi:hypothetical protein
MLRDPERLQRINDKVLEVWKLVPDWRYGQLIDKACTAVKGRAHSGSIFYYEDDVIEQGLNLLKERFTRDTSTNISGSAE